MARPRKSSSGKTSFGKRSEAEKSFRDKKKRSGRGDDPRGSFPPRGDSESSPRTSRFGGTGKSSFSKRDGDSSERPRSSFSRGGDSDRPRPSRFGGTGKPSFGKREGDSSERPKRFSKPFEKRDGNASGPFRKRSSDSFQSRTEGPSRFEKKPFQKRDDSGNERSYKKRESGPFEPRSDRSSGFGKKPFTKREDSGDEKPFRRSSSFGSRPGSAPRFEKKSFDRKDEGGERPFKKRESSSFDSRSERPERTSGFKKPFVKREDGGEEKPFKKRESPSFDSRPEKPAHFEKKPFARKEDEVKPFRKSESGEPDAGEEKSFTKGSNYGLPYKRKPFDKARDIKSTKRAKAEEKPKSDSDLIRLNKFIANSGVGSRREADELIKMGLVTVNGETITEMGHKVKITDEVRYEGKKLKAEKPVYVLLNKPKGFITTTDDPQERNTVMNLVAGAGKERIYPVGRLDRNTTGLLLLTNDGDLADKLTHPSYNVKKIYKVELDKPLTKNDFTKIQEGVRLEEGKALVDDLAIIGDDNKVVGIELHIGWNRIVRRIFESLGYEVMKLDRVVYAGLDKKDLGRGEWRFLKPEEVVTLKHFK